MRYLTLFHFACLWLCASVALAVETQQRVALVIGNSDYSQSAPLQNPLADAEAIATQLRELNFDVQHQIDLDRQAMEKALYDFGFEAERADVALIYYAGHGVQVDGENYLLPIDAELRHIRDLRRLLKLDDMLSEVSLAEKLGIVILDACRDNPLAGPLFDSLQQSRSASTSRGLARVDNAPRNTLVAFATQADAVAADGEGEQHSPYTDALLEHLAKPGLELGLMFRQVRDSVIQKTRGRQKPFTYGSLGGEPFYFMPGLPPAVERSLQVCAAYRSAGQLDSALACYRPLLGEYPAIEEIKTAAGNLLGDIRARAEKLIKAAEKEANDAEQLSAKIANRLAAIKSAAPSDARLIGLERRFTEVRSAQNVTTTVTIPNAEIERARRQRNSLMITLDYARSYESVMENFLRNYSQLNTTALVEANLLKKEIASLREKVLSANSQFRRTSSDNQRIIDELKKKLAAEP